MAREGFARMCGEPYNMRALNNQRGHLTNMSIQLKGAETDVPVSRTEFQTGNAARHANTVCLKSWSQNFVANKTVFP